MLALEALPDAVRHAFEVGAEKMVWLLTAAAINEIAWIFALKAVVRVLEQINRIQFRFD